MQRFKIKYLLLLLVGITGQLPAQPGRDWFEKNDRGNRYEGSYTKKVSNPSVNLVSLMSAPVPSYAFGNRQQLQVRFFSPSGQDYQLHAEELQVTQFYWLQDKNEQAGAGWNEFGDWHVDYMLKRLSISPRNLGVLVRLGEPGSRSFSPAVISLQGKAPQKTRYIAQLRLGRPVARGSFKVFMGKERRPADLVMEKPITAKSSGMVFPIVLPANALGDAPGWVAVEVNLFEKRTLDPFTYSFSFYHRPGE